MRKVMTVVTLVCLSLLISLKFLKTGIVATYLEERNFNDNTFPSCMRYQLMLCKGCCDCAVKAEPFDRLAGGHTDTHTQLHLLNKCTLSFLVLKAFFTILLFFFISLSGSVSPFVCLLSTALTLFLSRSCFEYCIQSGRLCIAVQRHHWEEGEIHS